MLVELRRLRYLLGSAITAKESSSPRSRQSIALGGLLLPLLSQFIEALTGFLGAVGANDSLEPFAHHVLVLRACMGENIPHEVNLPALPDCSMKTASGRLHQPALIIRDDLVNIFEPTLF